MEYYSMYDKIKRDVIWASPLSSKVADFVAELDRPFSQPSFFARATAKMLEKIIATLEHFLGEKLYLRIFGDEFDLLTPGLKQLLHTLFEKEIISSFEFKHPEENWPSVVLANAKLNPITLPSGAKRSLDGTAGAGCALDHASATQRALAELLERYSLCVYDPTQFVTGAFDQLKHRGAIDPLRFFGFSYNQMRNPEYRARHSLSAESIFRWTKTYSLIDHRLHLIPAQLVYLMYEPGESEPMIRQTTTSGAAAGSSWEMAAYRAICEVIERDAFMIFWLNKLTPPRIDPSSVQNPIVNRLLTECRWHKVEIHILDITTDLGVPTMLALSLNHHDDEKSRAVAINARTDLDPEKAIEGVLLEHLKRFVFREPAEEILSRIESIAPHLRTIEERRAFWHSKARISEVEFLLKGPRKLPGTSSFTTASYKEKLIALKAILQDNNLDVYLTDITAPLAKEYGLIVTMSLIPALYPLYLNERFKYLGIERLYRAPILMGYASTPKREDEMNPTPHPFL